MIKKELSATMIILIIGFSILFIGTDSFQAVTEEQVRRVKIQKEQPHLPNVTFQDSNGEHFQLNDIQSTYTIATFFYTRCGDVCPIMEMNLQKLYKQIPEKWLGNKIEFLSISFDPTYDTPDQLSKYKKMFNAYGESWRMVRVNHQGELRKLLDEAGVVVIPNKQGGFTHNAAFYLINPEGRLIKIYDFNEPDKVFNQLTPILDEGARR